MELSGTQRTDFIETVWGYYYEHGRHNLPWRLPESDGSFDPYKILVSELMLQQTQVSRVIPKYHAFLKAFPTAERLAGAQLAEVLRAWQGLGYNRRAKFLWQAAQAVVALPAFPKTVPELVKLPGVGANTAGAIAAYAFNEPVVFVETNIRTVYIHHFTPDGEIVSDDFIRDLLHQTIDVEHSREWYWALMDYGAWLKSQVRNISQSKHYTKQSTFQGSKRQVRGAIIRLLSAKAMTKSQLEMAVNDPRFPVVIEELLQEGLIQCARGQYRL